MAVAVGPTPELLDDPGTECSGRVHERVPDRLRPRRLLPRVAGVPFSGVLERGERRSLTLVEVVESGRIRRRERRNEGDPEHVPRGLLADARRDASSPVAP